MSGKLFRLVDLLGTERPSCVREFPGKSGITVRIVALSPKEEGDATDRAIETLRARHKDPLAYETAVANGRLEARRLTEILAAAVRQPNDVSVPLATADEYESECTVDQVTALAEMVMAFTAEQSPFTGANGMTPDQVVETVLEQRRAGTLSDWIVRSAFILRHASIISLADQLLRLRSGNFSNSFEPQSQPGSSSATTEGPTTSSAP